MKFLKACRVHKTLRQRSEAEHPCHWPIYFHHNYPTSYMHAFPPPPQPPGRTSAESVRLLRTSQSPHELVFCGTVQWNADLRSPGAKHPLNQPRHGRYRTRGLTHHPNPASSVAPVPRLPRSPTHLDAGPAFPRSTYPTGTTYSDYNLLAVAPTRIILKCSEHVSTRRPP